MSTRNLVFGIHISYVPFVVTLRICGLFSFLVSILLGSF